MGRAAEVFDADFVEIRVGSGALANLYAFMAAANPGVAMIGCEPFINGVAMCLYAHENAGLTNVRIHAGDAREIFDVAEDGAFERIFVNYPDPWPKSRHHKRRFIGPDNLPHLSRICAVGGRLHIATDIEDYVRHSMEAISASSSDRCERPVASSVTKLSIMQIAKTTVPKAIATCGIQSGVASRPGEMSWKRHVWCVNSTACQAK